jgi:curved DNA-binding protein
MDDYYQILGVDKAATQEEIKSAYRKLASKHHPDRGGDTATFQKIQAAYDIVGDSAKRAEYDSPQSQGFHHTGGIPPGFEDIFRHFSSGLGDIFGNAGARHQQPRNRTLNLQTTISLEEAFTGKDLVATIKLPTGRDQIVNVKIPAGVNDGTTLRLVGLGDDSYPNLPRGDIHLSIIVVPNLQFERQGDDLVTELDIDALDAILGTDTNVETIDHKILSISIKPGTQPGTIMGIQGYGMPNMHDTKFKGRLLLKIKIIIPTFLTDEQKELIKQART